MKHLKPYHLFESQGLTPEQERFLEACVDPSSTWTLNPETGLVDIEGSFYCIGGQLNIGPGGPQPYTSPLTDFLGIRFGHVTGNFSVTRKQLTSLEGAPQRVDGDFNCGHNTLIDLDGAPQRVGGNFSCHGNKLTSLEGGPREVEGGYYCQNNQLVNLKGAPPSPKCLHASTNPLESLEGIPRNIPRITETMTAAFICDAFIVREWNKKIALQLFLGRLDDKVNFLNPSSIHVIKDPEKTRDLVLHLMSPEAIDDYIRKNPLDMDFLDDFPHIKAGVLQRTGLKDMSSLARTMRKGIF